MEQANTALSELEAGRTVDNIPGLEALSRPSVQPYLSHGSRWIRPL